MSLIASHVILEALATLRNRAFAKIARDQQLDSALHILGLKRLLVPIDDKHSTLTHDIIKSVSHDRIHCPHSFLANPDLLLLV